MAVFALLGATNGEVRNFAVKTIVGAASPFFKFSRFAVEKKDSFFSCLETNNLWTKN